MQNQAFSTILNRMNQERKPDTNETSENSFHPKLRSNEPESNEETYASNEEEGLIQTGGKMILKRFFALLQFLVISTLVFCVIFFVLNWSAYAQIITDYLNPEAAKPAEIALERSIYEPEKAQELLKISKRRKEFKKNFPPLDLKPSPPDNRIIIPKLGKNIPIVEINNKKFDSIAKLAGKEFEGAIQDALEAGVVHYPGTALPGQFGNFFVTGHSSYYPWAPGKYKDVFALLEKLNVGDTYYIYFNQKKYTYKIFDKKDVQPTDISVLAQPNNQKIGTLMTCTPVGTDLRRLILVAEQI